MPDSTDVVAERLRGHYGEDAGHVSAAFVDEWRRFHSAGCALAVNGPQNEIARQLEILDRAAEVADSRDPDEVAYYEWARMAAVVAIKDATAAMRSTRLLVWRVRRAAGTADSWHRVRRCVPSPRASRLLPTPRPRQTRRTATHARRRAAPRRRSGEVPDELGLRRRGGRR
jgi:hypothetical protein